MEQVLAYLHAQNPKLGLKDLAKHLGLSKNTVKKWKKVPAHHVLAVEALSGGALSRYALRPDIYGQKQDAA